MSELALAFFPGLSVLFLGPGSKRGLLIWGPRINENVCPLASNAAAKELWKITGCGFFSNSSEGLHGQGGWAGIREQRLGLLPFIIRVTEGSSVEMVEMTI